MFGKKSERSSLAGRQDAGSVGDGARIRGHVSRRRGPSGTSEVPCVHDDGPNAPQSKYLRLFIFNYYSLSHTTRRRGLITFTI